MGVDSFRASLGLSTLKPNRSRQFQWVLAFGVFDAATPMVGFLLGHSALDWIGSQIGYLGPICFIIYGIYILCFARTQQTEENDHWLILGLPMSFSLDNLVAGAGLGLLAFPPIVSAAILGLMSSLLAWLGLRMGALLVHKLALRAERITGAIFIVVAISLFIDQS